MLFLLTSSDDVLNKNLSVERIEFRFSSSANFKTAFKFYLCLFCFVTAARLMNAMDASVDPCEDFFEYSCGSWNRINIIPDDRAYYNTFSKLRDDVHAILTGWTENLQCGVRGGGGCGGEEVGGGVEGFEGEIQLGTGSTSSHDDGDDDDDFSLL
jgi:hypothetical protein